MWFRARTHSSTLVGWPWLPRTVAAGLALTLLWSAESAAQGAAALAEPPSQTAAESSAYVITVAGKREAAAGASETALSRGQIAAMPGGESQPLAYALAAQPGVVADTFGFGLHVRGADGGLLYVVDGIPLLAAPLGQWGAALGFVPTRLVQSVHFTTGGFPAEYGSGLGAVVDINTRRAVGGPAGELTASYGTYKTGQFSMNYSQEVGKLSLLVGGNFLTSDRGLDPPSSGALLHDATTSGGLFARLDYRLGEHERLEFIAMFDQSLFQIPIDPTASPLAAGAVRGTDAYGNAPAPFVPYDANPVESEHNVFAAVSYVRALAAGTLQISPFFRESFGNLTCDPLRALGATADAGSTCSDVRRDVLHGGATGSAEFGKSAHQSWKAGVLFDQAWSNVAYTGYFRDDTASSGGPDPAQTRAGTDVTSVMLAGAYVQDKLQAGKWTVLPGFRLDLEGASFAHSDEPALLLLGPSVRLGAAYAVSEAVAIHGFVGYLWQPPSTIDAPVAGRVLMPGLAAQILPVDVKAEKDLSAEFGVTGRIFHRFTLGMTGWGRLASDQLDRVNVGPTNLVASYNFARGRATGVEASLRGSVGGLLDGFANTGWQLAQGQGIDSERFLFTASELADKRWVMLDHVQTWTANLGMDVHDSAARSHVSALVQYGSGLRTGADSDKTVPAHLTIDLTLRHRVDVSPHVQPEFALDVLNLLNDPYAYRLGTGYIGSAYAPLRRVFLRLSIPFSS